MNDAVNRAMFRIRLDLIQEGWEFNGELNPYTMRHPTGYVLSMSHVRGLLFVLVYPKEEQTRFKNALPFNKWEDFVASLKHHGLRQKAA